jgi:phage repressor protein C with HTH and peptisase S24 domain
VRVSLLRVSGASMRPSLRDGARVLVRWGAPARAGSMVVASFPARPDVLVVKRAVRPDGDRWWVEGDDPAASDDSRVHGPADVLGRVVWPRRSLAQAPRRSA